MYTVLGKSSIHLPTYMRLASKRMLDQLQSSTRFAYNSKRQLYSYLAILGTVFMVAKSVHNSKKKPPIHSPTCSYQPPLSFHLL